MTPVHVRYEAGSSDAAWVFVAGRSFVASVQSTASSSVLDALWWLAETDFAEIESVVGAFPLSGPEEVSSFAVVSFGSIATERKDALVTAIVRGDACVDVFSIGGARRFAADGIEPWLLADFRSVTGFVLTGVGTTPSVSPRLTDRALPLRIGAAEGNALAWSLDPIERGGSASPDTSGSRARVPDADSSAAGSPLAGASQSSGAQSLAASLPPETRAAADGDFGDDTLVLARRPLPPIPETGEHGAGASGPSDREPAFTLRVGVSESILLDQPTIVGRNPRAPGVPYGEAARLVTVASPELEVSSSHVQIQQVGDAVVVTDLRSTNGTFILRDDNAPERLRPGESRVVPAGVAVDIGDGNIIEIAHIRTAR